MQFLYKFKVSVHILSKLNFSFKVFIAFLFKILRSDSAEDFDELGYEFFNTTGLPDQTVAASLKRDDFQEYLYTAGVTDDGIGESLPEFIAFSIKIVLQASNAAQPPRIKDLRAIALAT